jgi:hypothetical protein
MELNAYLIYAQLGLDLLVLLAVLILARRIKGLSSERMGQGRFSALLKDHEMGLLGSEACSRNRAGQDRRRREGQGDLKQIARRACGLADRGIGLEEIARELGMSLSEVELLICLNRQGMYHNRADHEGVDHESGQESGSGSGNQALDR